MSQPSRQRSLPGLEPEFDCPDGIADASKSNQQHEIAAVESHTRPNAAENSPAAQVDLKDKTVYVLDAFSLVFQVFHALPEMTSPQGEAVGAVYGFARDVLYILDKQPDFVFCAFDLPGPTFRNELYDQYKINRTSMPDELVPQVAKVRRVLDALGVPVVEYEGFEADDVIATLARVCDQAGARCLLVTNDKDCRQLITDRVSVYNVRKDQVIDADTLRAEWGIRPDQVIDFQSLVGDKVDNVPGVPLIGPKIAAELLNTYGTLEAVLEHAGEIKAAQRRKNLLASREQVLLSRQLVRLDCHVPLKFDWEAARAGHFDRAQAADLFAEFGFRTFREKMAAEAKAAAPTLWEADYRLVNSPEALAELTDELSRQQLVSIDTETTSRYPRWAKLVGLSLAWEPGRAYYIPVRGPSGAQVLDEQTVLAALRPVLESPAIRKIGQNLKYDLIVLRGAGVHLRGLAFDTMVASYLLDAGERNHSLDELARRYLNHTTIPITQLLGTGKQQREMNEVPLAEVAEYAGEDADVPLRLETQLAQRLDAWQLGSLFAEVEMPLVEVLADLEWTGMRVDLERLAALSKDYGARLDALEQEIYALAGHELNIASPRQLAVVLFEELNLPVVKKTRTGPSTDVDVLAQLAKVHPLPAKIIEFRQFAKLKNTYVDALPAMVHPETGRLHACYNQVVAATGRLSSSDPNLQNIPVRNDRGREIRSAFLPEIGWQLLAGDYSQIELRVLAHFSQDARLLEAFANDEDIHTAVASEVYRVPAGEVTSDMRRTAKAVNFGIIYGQSPYGLAAALDIPQSEAAQFIEAYFAQYPGVEKFLSETLEQCAKKGYVTTILGRRRAIRGVRTGVGRLRNLPERTAINTVIQGSAADLIKLAMINIHRRLGQEQLDARMLLQIHDELIFEVSPGHLSSLAALVGAEMAEVMKLSVPLKVDLKSGKNWADCEPY